MSDVQTPDAQSENTNPETPAAPDNQDAPKTPETPTTDNQGNDEELGDAGKKALAAERTARKAADKKAAELEAEVSRLRRANAATKGTDLDAIKSELRAEFTAQLVRAEVKAAAAGRLADPSDALRLLDLDGMSASDTGEVDGAAVKAAIDKLLTDKPYLAAQDGRKHWGDVGGGQRTAPEPEPSTPEERMRRAYGRKSN